MNVKMKDEDVEVRSQHIILCRMTYYLFIDDLHWPITADYVYARSRSPQFTPALFRKRNSCIAAMETSRGDIFV